MRPNDDLFDRLRAAIDGGNPLDMRVRELRACANLIEMHVAEATPDPRVVDTLHGLLINLADLRQLPRDRRHRVEAALHEIRKFAFP